MSITSSIRIFLAFICLVFSSINSVYADPDKTNTATTNAIEQTLCNVVKSLTGTLGKSVATIAIIALAIGLFLGKLSWGLALATGAGVGMIFGSASIVDWLSKDTGGAVSGFGTVDSSSKCK